MEFSLYSVLVAIVTSLLLVGFLKLLLCRRKFDPLIHYDFLTMLVWMIFYRLFMPCSFMIGISMPFGDLYHELVEFLEQPLWYEITGFGWISWIWLAGALVSWTYYKLGAQRNKVIASLILQDARRCEIVDLLPDWVGPEYPVYISPHVRTTFVMGWAGIIVLPDRPMTQKELEFVILHEARHLFNEDGLYMCLIRYLQILYWWFPLIFHYTDVLGLFYEIRVDSMVIEPFEPSTILDYGETLLKFSRCRKGSMAPRLSRREVCALRFSATEHLETRIMHLLRASDRPKRTGIDAYLLMVLIYSISAFLVLAENNLLFF